MMGLGCTKTDAASGSSTQETSAHTTEPLRLDEEVPGMQYDEQGLPEDDWH